VFGTGGRRSERLLHLEHPIHRATKERDLVREKGAEAAATITVPFEALAWFRDALHEASDRVEARERRQVVEVIEEDRSPRILPEKLHDRMDQVRSPARWARTVRSSFETVVIQRIGVRSRPKRTATREGARPVTHSPASRTTMSRKRPHRGAPSVLEDQVVQASLQAVPRRPRRLHLGHWLDHEIPVPGDAYAMKIDHINVYNEPRPNRVSLEEIMGHRSSVTAAGTVRDQTEEDDTEHPSTRRLPNLPPRADEEHHGSEHPNEK